MRPFGENVRSPSRDRALDPAKRVFDDRTSRHLPMELAGLKNVPEPVAVVKVDPNDRRERGDCRRVPKLHDLTRQALIASVHLPQNPRIGPIHGLPAAYRHAGFRENGGRNRTSRQDPRHAPGDLVTPRLALDDRKVDGRAIVRGNERWSPERAQKSDRGQRRRPRGARCRTRPMRRRQTPQGSSRGARPACPEASR